MSDLSWLNLTPCNRCVRFAPTVAGGHATLATKRTLLLTWAGLPPAGSHQLFLAHLFNHLIGPYQEGLRNGQSQLVCRLKIDHQLKFAWCLHRELAWHCPAQNAIDVRCG